jgi:hypothetical protein
MIIADLVGRRLEGIDSSLATLKLIFEDGIVLEIYPYIERAGVKPEIAWTIKPPRTGSERER